MRKTVGETWLHHYTQHIMSRAVRIYILRCFTWLIISAELIFRACCDTSRTIFPTAYVRTIAIASTNYDNKKTIRLFCKPCFEFPCFEIPRFENPRFKTGRCKTGKLKSARIGPYSKFQKHINDGPAPRHDPSLICF